MDLSTTQSLPLDFCKSELKTIKAKQYDKNSRFINITCTENGKVKTLNTSVKCVFKMLTPDGRAIYDDATIKEDGSILVELTETALSHPGTGDAEINIFDLDSNALLSTKKFNIDIEGSVYPNDTVISSPEFNALTNMIFDVNESIETVNGFKDAENERKENEKKRVQAEITRENNSNTAISNVNSATKIAKEKIEEAEDRLHTLTTKIEECNITSEKAEKSAISAENSARIATEKASNASASESSASTFAKNAKDSETSAKTSETNSKINQQNAKSSETNAKSSETNAASSAATATTKATEATTAANKASASANTSSTKATAAEKSAKTAESYAVGGTNSRTGENTDNAKYYKEQAERIAEGLKGSLIPMGTILFAALPDTSTAGYMYNISNEFTTTSRFKEGAGNVVPAGTNVYYTADGCWDCMAGSPVTGIKGSAESSYRRGNVNLTKANIGLGNVPDVATNDQTPTFTQSTTREVIKSGEKLSQILGKVSKWFADLKTGAFSTVVNNDTTTAAGYVADARIVKTHGDEIDALKKSVSDGKKSVAASITAQGVNTAADAEFSTMATNIKTVGTNKYNAGVSATKKGTATAGQVLTGYTFTNSSGVGLSGSMPNRGALNWNPGNSTSYTVPAGYYSGGTISSSAAYSQGVTDADNRPNGNSVNYVSGYNAGVAAADNRANPGSVNYQTGYNNGYGAGKGAATPYLSQHQHFQNQVYNSTVSVSGAITTSGTGLVCVLITLSTGTSELTVYDAYGASCSYAGTGLNCNAMYQHSFSITYRYNFAVTGGQTVSAYGFINAGAGGGGYRDGCRVTNIEILEMRTQ